MKLTIKRLQRLLCALLCCVMLAGMVPGIVLADDDAENADAAEDATVTDTTDVGTEQENDSKKDLQISSDDPDDTEGENPEAQNTSADDETSAVLYVDGDPAPADEEEKPVVTALTDDVQVTLKAAVTDTNAQPSSYTEGALNAYSGQYIWLYLEVVNNGSEEVTLDYQMNILWGESEYNSGYSAIRKPKEGESGSNKYDWSVTEGTFNSSGNHNTKSTITLPAGGRLVLRTTGGAIVDSTLPMGQQAGFTVTLTNHADPSDVITAAVMADVDWSFSVEQWHTENAATASTIEIIEDSHDLTIGQNTKFWVKITNLTNKDLTIYVDDTFTVNGAGDHDLYQSIERLVRRKDATAADGTSSESNVKSASMRDSSGTDRSDAEITLGAKGYIWIATNGGYTAPVGSEGDSVTNTVTVWVKGDESSKQTNALTLTVPGEKAFDVLQEFIVNDETTWQSGLGSIYEDDAVQFRATVSNLGGAGTVFTLGNTFYVDTSSGKDGTERNDLFSPNYVFNAKESRGVTNMGNGTYRFDREDAVAVFYAAPEYTPGAGYYNEHTARPQVTNTVTVSVSGTPKAENSVQLNINPPVARFTVDAAFSVNNGGWRTNNTSITKEQVTTKDGTKVNKQLQVMARVTNTGRSDLVIDLEKILAAFVRGSETLVTFSGAFINDLESSKDVTEQDGKVTIPAGSTVQIEWTGAWDLTASGVQDGNQIKLQITVKDQADLSASDEVTINITKREMHLGYSLSIASGHFPDGTLEYKGTGNFQRKTPDGYQNIEVDYWKTSDGIEIYDNGRTEGDNALKYMHVEPSDTGDVVQITSLVPVSDKDYTFICWYDKQARTGNELVLPGEYVSKDTETEHSIDAVWADMRAVNEYYIYDGEEHAVEAGGLVCAGEDSKYMFDMVRARYISNVEYDVVVIRPDGQTDEFKAWEDDDGNLVYEKYYTEVGVYRYTITANFIIQGQQTTEPKSTEGKAATLTILPRPVVVQVNSASYVYDGQPKTVEADGAEYKLIGTGFYFTGSALAADVKNVLTKDDTVKALAEISQNVDDKPMSVADITALYGRGDVGFVKGDSLYGSAAVVYGNDRTPNKTEVGEYKATVANVDELKDKETPSGNYIFIARDGLLTITGRAPNTGDGNNLLLWTALLTVSLGGLTCLGLLGRKKRQK